MHEFALAQSIADLVAESARTHSIGRVAQVRVVVGEWSAVLPEALTTSFAAIAGVAGPPLQGAVLTVEPRVATGRCNRCDREFAADQGGLSCPSCGSPAALIAGSEFYVDSYEGE